jgi:hypothetical protein
MRLLADRKAGNPTPIVLVGNVEWLAMRFICDLKAQLTAEGLLLGQSQSTGCACQLERMAVKYLLCLEGIMLEVQSHGRGRGHGKILNLDYDLP